MTLFKHEGQRSLVITEFTIHLFSLFQNRSYKAKEGRKTGIKKKSRYYWVLVVSIVVISGLRFTWISGLCFPKLCLQSIVCHMFLSDGEIGIKPFSVFVQLENI